MKEKQRLENNSYVDEKGRMKICRIVAKSWYDQTKGLNKTTQK